MLSLDSNILAYAIDQNAGARHRHASVLVQQAASVGAVLTDQSILELLNLSEIKAKRSMADARAIAEELLRHFQLIFPPRNITQRVLDLRQSYKLSVWDARMLAVCGANGCDVLLSEDMQDGARYDVVTVINPFNPANATTLALMLNP